jgi:hypothetical protein
MVIEQIFNVVTLILNKERRGFVKTSQKITAVRQAMYDYFDSQVELYRKANIIPSTIKHLLKTSQIIITSGTGNLPSDYSQEVVFVTDCGSEGVFLTQEEFTDRVKSTILTPDIENPIAKIENGKVIVEPDEITSIQFTYFRLPIDFVYATTVSGDGRSETFNAGASTDIEFNYEDSGEIIRRALLYLGVAFQNNEALQLAVSNQQQT